MADRTCYDFDETSKTFVNIRISTPVKIKIKDAIMTIFMKSKKKGEEVQNNDNCKNKNNFCLEQHT